MLKYAAMICDSRKTCTRCPIKALCREMVPITKEALTDWENRTEAKAKEICEEKQHEETKCNPVVTVSFIDAITQINSRRRNL
jgi:hypothetical protein